MDDSEDSKFIPRRNSPNEFMNEISLALRRLEEQRRDKPGHSVRKIAKQLRNNYTEDLSFEMQIDHELQRMAQTGAVVKNKLSKDAWKIVDSKLIVQKRGQRKAVRCVEQGTHDDRHLLCEEQPSDFRHDHNEPPSCSWQRFSSDLRSLGDEPDEDADMTECSDQQHTVSASASTTADEDADLTEYSDQQHTVSASASRTSTGSSSTIVSGDSVDDPCVSPEQLALEARLSETTAEVVTAFNKNFKISFEDRQMSGFPRCPCQRCTALNVPLMAVPALPGHVASPSAHGRGQSLGQHASIASTSGLGSGQSQGQHLCQASTSAFGSGHPQGLRVCQAGDMASTSGTQHSVRPMVHKRQSKATGDNEAQGTSHKCPRTDSTEDVGGSGTVADGEEDEVMPPEVDNYMDHVCDVECEEGGWCVIM